MHLVRWLLRIGVFGVYFGHGILAIQGKESWLVYLEFVGINKELAVILLPIIGSIDVIIAVSVIIKPLKPVLLYATVWAFGTALMRPLTGEPIWDFVERAGNWVTPLALLLLINMKTASKDRQLPK